MACNLIQIAAVLSTLVYPGIQPTLSQLMVLAHMDGANGTLASGNIAERGVVTGTNAVYTTATKAFGSASMDFQGGGSHYLSADLSSSLIGSVDFTLEIMVRLKSYNTTAGGYSGIMAGGAGNTGLCLYVKSDGTVVLADVQSARLSTVAGTVKLGVWTHIALTRSGSTFVIWVDGKTAATGNLANWQILTNSLALGFTAVAGSGYYMDGFIDEFRYCKGLAVYSQPFTPPTQPFIIPSA
jgi:hypothetical protein